MAVGAPPPEEAHVGRGACLVYVAIGVAGVVVLSLLAASRPGSWPARKNRKRMATLLLAYVTRLACLEATAAAANARLFLPRP